MQSPIYSFIAAITFAGGAFAGSVTGAADGFAEAHPFARAPIPVIEADALWAIDRITDEYGPGVTLISYAFPCAITYRRAGEKDIETFRPSETAQLCADLDKQARDGYIALSKENHRMLRIDDADAMQRRFGQLIDDQQKKRGTNGE